MQDPSLDFDPTAIIASMLPTLLFMGVVYVYFAYFLMVIAKKTNTEGVGLAWVPIANIYLMCKIGRKPTWWMLLAMLPCVNIIFLIIIWMGIAEARGKSPAIPWLFLVPIVGFVVPVLLAMGEPSAAAPAGGGRATSPRATGAAFTGHSAAPSSCPKCQSPIGAGEAFCGECGFRLESAPAAPGPPPAVASAGPTQPLPGKSSGAPVAILGGCLAVLVAFGGIGWFAVSKFVGGSSRTTANRQAPALPQRAAGALREFPVDTDLSNPARPTSVVRQSFRNGASESGQAVPASWLPPGLPQEELPRRASAITSATYKTGPIDPPVPVHVLETPGRSAGREIAGSIQRGVGSDAQTTSVRVESPDGDVYEGWRVQSPQVQIFVLQNPSASIVIIIYAPEPAAFQVAERLAGNVSNGEGLLDYPEFKETLGVLPVDPPSGLTLEEMTTYLPEDLGLSPGQLAAELGSDASPELRQLIEQLQQFIPQRITAARYRDTRAQSWDVLSGDYGSSFKAASIWFLARTMGAAGMSSIDVASGTGMWMNTADGPVLLLRAGSELIGLRAPPGSPVDRLVELANSLQI